MCQKRNNIKKQKGNIDNNSNNQKNYKNVTVIPNKHKKQKRKHGSK